VSPILVRPVREQLEHDRVIRLLQVRLKRRHEVTANIGEDQTTSVKIGLLQIFPDLVLTSADRGHKLEGTVEVETSESVNHLEARAQWAHLGRARAPFHLYVPAGSVEIARRLATENDVNVAEIWSYHTIGDQTRFTLVHKSPETRRAPEPKRTAPAPAAAPPASRPAAGARAVETVTGRGPESPGRPGRPGRNDKKVRPTRSSDKKAAASRTAKKRVAPQPRRGAPASVRGSRPTKKSKSAPATQKRK
jgi:hypothetical protein